jgi:hypothetical protein
MSAPDAQLLSDLLADLLHIKAHTISALAWYHTSLANTPDRQPSDQIEVELNVVLGWVEAALNSLDALRSATKPPKT